MNLEQYISQLIEENEMVIVPGFGAFISAYKHAEIDEESKQISPPSIEISFSQKIRNNDGLLVDYIAKIDDISHFEALQKIEKEREKFLYQLDKGEKIVFENVGTIYYDESNKIQFIPAASKNLLLDAYGLETVEIKEVSVNDSNIETEDKNSKKEEDKEKVIVTEPEIETDEIFRDWRKKEPEKKEKRSWLWLFFIVIPLIAAGIYMVLNQKKKSRDTINVQTEKAFLQAPQKVNEIKSDSAKNDSVLITDKDKIPEPSDNIVNTNSSDTLAGTKYYLVGGSFEEKENAEEYLHELREKGYNPFHVGKKGKFYLVGINIYNSEREALKDQRMFKEENPGSGAWIYEE